MSIHAYDNDAGNNNEGDVEDDDDEVDGVDRDEDNEEQCSDPVLKHVCLTR